MFTDEPKVTLLIADDGHENETGSIYKLNVQHMALTRLSIYNVVRPTGIDFDPEEQLVYFTDVQTKQLRRVDMNGGNDVIVARLNSSRDVFIYVIGVDLIVCC